MVPLLIAWFAGCQLLDPSVEFCDHSLHQVGPEIGPPHVVLLLGQLLAPFAGQRREMRNYAFWSILAKQNEAVLPLVELDAPPVAEKKLSHQSKERCDRLLVEPVVLLFFFGLGLVPLGMLFFDASLVMLPRAQQERAKGCQSIHQSLVVRIHQSVHG